MENKVTRITTLEEHRKLLRMVFETAKSRVLIVSPFVSDSAINADNIPGLIRTATRNGVTVSVYTDDRLNTTEGGVAKAAASKGIEILANSGAEVYIMSGIHHKTLIRDNDLIAEGSFNWLSAVRDAGARHQREERSLVYTGTTAPQMINEETAKLLKTVPRLTAKQYKSSYKTNAFEKACFGAILAFFTMLYILYTINKNNKTYTKETAMDAATQYTNTSYSDSMVIFVIIVVGILLLAWKVRKDVATSTGQAKEGGSFLHSEDTEGITLEQPRQIDCTANASPRYIED